MVGYSIKHSTSSLIFLSPFLFQIGYNCARQIPLEAEKKKKIYILKLIQIGSVHSRNKPPIILFLNGK